MAAKKTKLEITKHDKSVIHAVADNYNPKETSEAIIKAQNNETSDYMVLIGDQIIDARSIESVVKIED